MFNPYSGVKTSILILDKALAKKKDKIGFFKVEHDGFDLGAQRREIDRNDLPDTAQGVKEYMNMDAQDGQDKKESGSSVLDSLIERGAALIVEKERIAADGDYNLSGERYREVTFSSSSWPFVSLGELCNLVRGVTYSKADEIADGGHKVLRANNISKNTFSLDLSEIKHVSAALKFDDHKKLRKDDVFICLASGSKDHIGKVALLEEDVEFFFGGFMGAVRANPDRLYPRFLLLSITECSFQ